MLRDALARRLRHAPPQPGERVVPTDADFKLFEAIDRHGPLPTNYLYEFTKHVRRDYANLQFRLTKFYNGDGLGPYLARPPRQFDSYEARYQHAVYALAPRAKVALAERGTLGRYAPPRASPFVHQLMTSCVGASLELAATTGGLRYISREEIIGRRMSKHGAMAVNPLALPVGSKTGSVIVPDDLFGLEYPGAGFRFFAVEVDRNTESIDRRDLAQTSFGNKIRAYGEALRSRAFEQHWDIPNLTVLTVTTNAVHAERMCAMVGRKGLHADRFAFAVESSFGTSWRVPKVLLAYLLSEPWMTAAGPRRFDRP